VSATLRVVRASRTTEAALNSPSDGFGLVLGGVGAHLIVDRAGSTNVTIEIVKEARS